MTAHAARWVRPRRVLQLVTAALVLCGAAVVLRLWLTGQFERWSLEKLPAAEVARRAARPQARYLELIEWAGRLEAEGNMVQAARVFGRAVESDPARYEGWLGWGRATFGAGDWKEAERIIQKTVEMWPERGEARFVRAALYGSTWRKRLAREDLLAGLRRIPGSGPAWQSLGDLEMDRKDAAAAVRAYRRSLALQPGSAYVKSRLGAALLQTGEVRAALPLLEESLKLDPSDMDARFYLAETLAATGVPENRTRALVEFNRVVTFSANKSRPWVAVARVWMSENNRGDAIQALERAVDFNPHSEEALALLVELYRKEGREAEARRFEPELARARRLNEQIAALQAQLDAGRDLGENLLKLAGLYRTQGDRARARSLLSAAAAVLPGDRRPTAALADMERARPTDATSLGRFSPPPQGP